MEQRMQAWLREAEDLKQRYIAAFEGLSGEALNWKVSSDRWSIAQVLDHVITANRSYYPTFEALKKGTYRPHWITRLPGLPRLLGYLILRATEPESRRAVKTFDIWEPAQSAFPADILDRFAREQDLFIRELEALHPLIGKGVVITSPAHELAPYRLDTAIDILLAHEQRHYRQALEVKTAWEQGRA